MAEITLGGRVYAVEPLRLREAGEWRNALKRALVPVFEESGRRGMAELGPAMLAVAPTSLAPDAMLEFVLGWSDALEADREHILDHGTDAEVLVAFKTLLEVAYPFPLPPAVAARQANGATPLPVPSI